VDNDTSEIPRKGIIALEDYDQLYSTAVLQSLSGLTGGHRWWDEEKMDQLIISVTITSHPDTEFIKEFIR